MLAESSSLQLPPPAVGHKLIYIPHIFLYVRANNYSSRLSSYIAQLSFYDFFLSWLRAHFKRYKRTVLERNGTTEITSRGDEYKSEVIKGPLGS